MGQKTKGGMFCPTCNKPVMGVKNTHRIRNAVSVGGVIATSGLSLAGSKVEGYICPNCGSKVSPKHGGGNATASLVTWGDLFKLLGALIAWVVVSLALVILSAFVLPYRLATQRKEPVPLEKSVRAGYAKACAWVGATSRRLDR